VPNLILGLSFWEKLIPRRIDSGSYAAGDGVSFDDDTSLLQSLFPVPNLMLGGFL
jgi:hypothetical protein